jgi:LPXTG-motif cell wall-anchored protein
MHASNQTGRARLVRRIARAVGVMAIASGVAVTGAAATTHATGPTTTATLTLHNTSASNFGIVDGQCDGFALKDPTKSYWHFVVSTNNYSFVSLTLHLDPPGSTTTYDTNSTGVTINGKHAYIPVPVGATLASLQGDSTAVITPEAPLSALPNFNLSHTCSAGETPPPPPADVCPNIADDQASVPEGMFVNEDGDCVPSDVCNNIADDQPEIPAGMISDGDGGCIPDDECDTLLQSSQEQFALVANEDCTPVDVCNNIPEAQAEIPSGMISDGDGGCVTPPVDVCNNIEQAQATIPSGLISDGNGGCVTPPVDVCNNIDQAQATIPSGLITDGNGGCVTPPVDLCNNISGAQTTRPSGTIDDGNGGCVTPPIVQSNPPAPTDVCSNIDGAQATVPSGFTASGTTCTAIEVSEAVAPADVTLPVTGSNTASGIAIGLAMVGAGLILSALARRRSARSNA